MGSKILTNYEKNILTLIASTVIPNPRGPFTKSVTDADVASLVDDHLSYVSFDSRLTYRLFLYIMEWGGIFYKFRFRRFSRMNPEQRKEYLGAWHRTWWSPKRLIARFIEALITMNYYSVPEVAAECGYLPHFKAPLFLPKYSEGTVISAPQKNVNEITADVCVIGSGAGGAAAAKELAEMGHEVVILEEGSLHTTEEFGKDVLTMTKMLYRDGGILATFGWPNILVPLGRCVGGTTTINSGTCFRCPDHVFDRWGNEHGLSTWNAGKMKKYFDRVENILQVSVPPSNILGRNTEVFRRGLDAMNLSGGVIPRNAPGCCGSGVCPFGCPTGAKKSTELSYIPLAIQHGAKLYTNCMAERLERDNGRAQGVLASFVDPITRKRTGKLFVRARVIIVSCGTMHTPVFLKNSHLPDTSGSIGENLTLHPAAKVIALFDEEVKSWQGIPQGYHMDSLDAEGIKLEQIFTPPAFVASSLMLSGEAHSEVMAAYNRLAAFGLIVSDTSRGRIIRMPKNRAVIWYRVNKFDLPKYIRGIAYLSEIFFAAGAKKVFPCIYKFPVVTREEGAKKIYDRKIRAKDIDLQAFHPLGTCRMGADPREAAVDPQGRLYGMENVYVADGSIFPTSIGVNPQVTIMAAATKIAEHIHHDQF